jgi:hypothetical protein
MLGDIKTNDYTCYYGMVTIEKIWTGNLIYWTLNLIF